MPDDKEAAEANIQDSYRSLLAARGVERKELEAFAERCKEAHKLGVTDERIKDLIVDLDDKGYSRARIQQLRCGKLTKKG